MSNEKSLVNSISKELIKQAEKNKAGGDSCSCAVIKSLVEIVEETVCCLSMNDKLKLHTTLSSLNIQDEEISGTLNRVASLIRSNMNMNT